MTNESIHIFGEDKNLQGIAAEPEQWKTHEVAVLLFNAGIVHKVGPFNLNVELSRKLSSSGYLVFRFDLSGLGDSYKIKTGKTYDEMAINDFCQAMTHIESQYGVTKFLIIGLCTGADHAHKISVIDDRVIGCVYLDGYGYPTLRFMLNRYLPVFLTPSRLIKSLFSHLKFKKNINNVSGIDAYVWKLPGKKNYIQDMNKLYQRGVKHLYIFSGGVKVYYNYKDQLKDGFRKYKFWSTIEVEYYPMFDHTYIILNDKNVLIERITSWIDENFN